MHFETGLYAYVGSAHGPGGLRARVGRHLRRDKPRHWHVDALTALAVVTHVAYVVSPERLECAWAQAVSALPGARIPLPGFGSSDCRCPAHLFALPADPLPALLRTLDRPDRPLIIVSV